MEHTPPRSPQLTDWPTVLPSARRKPRAANARTRFVMAADTMYESTVQDVAWKVGITQQGVSNVEKRLMKKLKMCLLSVQRDGGFDRSDPDAGPVFFQALVEALRKVNGQKNALLIEPL